MARSGSCHSLPLVLLALVCTLATLAAARPTAQLSNPAAYDSLLRRASPEVGPQRALERLRRRALDFRTAQRSALLNPKAKRDLTGPVRNVKRNTMPVSPTKTTTPAPLTNPKLAARALVVSGPRFNPKKRSLAGTSVPSNPKTKRALAPIPVGNPKARRTFAPVFLANPKAKPQLPTPTAALTTRHLLPASIERRTVVLQPRRRRSILDFLSAVVSGEAAKREMLPPANPKQRLARRSIVATRIGIVDFVPNPKADDFAAISSSIASVLSVSSAATRTTSTPQASATGQSCQKTIDCRIYSFPDFAHGKCSNGGCTFACDDGYSKNSAGTGCVLSPAHTSTTTAPKASATGQACKKTVDCSIYAFPDFAHGKCSNGGCTFGCNDGYSKNSAGTGCVLASSTTQRPTTTTAAHTSTTAAAKASATGQACQKTIDCRIYAFPNFAHGLCSDGGCTFACDAGYSKNKAGTGCVLATSTSKTTTSKSVSSTPAATATSWPTGKYISSSYYPDWDGDLLPPSDVDMSLFDLIFFAFAVPTASFGVEFLQDNSGTLLKQLIKYAHGAGNNTKVVISIGGWTDSVYFSAAVKNSANRQTFIANIVAMVNKYDADGVDIDWEYPGGGGESNNIVSTSDTANFLIFLKGLRAALGPDKQISTCTTQEPFIGADGSPLTDVSAFAEYINHIMVMNYDVWGASSTPGPNAPLSDACPDSNQPNANEESAIETWTAAGMPASKIIMGVPSYGYISSSSATTLIHKRSVDVATRDARSLTSSRPRGMSNRERAATLHTESKRSPMHRWFLEGQRKLARRKLEARRIKLAERKAVSEQLKKRGTILICPNNHSGEPCGGTKNQTIKTIDWNPLNGTTSGNGTSGSGVFGGGVGVGKLGNGNLATIDGNQIQFYQLISYGVLVQQGTSSTFTAVNDYVRKWDTCSHTPYLYNTARKVVITYDDPQSLALKGQLAATKKIAGIGMWDISGDTVDWQLVKSFRGGMGLS